MSMKSKLKARMIEKGITQQQLAELMGITYQSISLKMNRKKEFKHTEIYVIVKVLDLTPFDIYDIFFSENSIYSDVI